MPKWRSVKRHLRNERRRSRSRRNNSGCLGLIVMALLLLFLIWGLGYTSERVWQAYLNNLLIRG